MDLELGSDFEPGEGTAMDYSLRENDCMGFMVDVAKHFKPTLEVPKRGATELPRDYLRRMIEAN